MGERGEVELIHRKIASGNWQLVRQDDHGNRYLMATFASKEEAQKALATYETRGHKQTYWIEAVNVDTRAPHPARSRL